MQVHIDISNAVVITSYANAHPHANAIEGRRFAVVNGFLFELSRYECAGQADKHIVAIYEAQGVENPTCHADMGICYSAEYFIIAIEYGSLDAAVEAFLDLQRETMKNPSDAEDAIVALHDEYSK